MTTCSLGPPRNGHHDKERHCMPRCGQELCAFLMNRMHENATGTQDEASCQRKGDGHQRTRHALHALFARQISGLHLPAVRHRLEPLMERGLRRCGITDLSSSSASSETIEHSAPTACARILPTPPTPWVRAWEIQEAIDRQGFHRSVPTWIHSGGAERHGTVSA